MKVSRYYIILILEHSDFNFRVSNEMFFFFLKKELYFQREGSQINVDLFHPIVVK